MGDDLCAERWDVLLDDYGVSEETLQVVTDINGYTPEALDDVLYAVAGLHFDEDSANV